MKVVLDTNVLLIAISLESPYRPIFDSLKAEDYELVVTTEILQEYEEIIARRTSPVVADNILRLLLALPNVEKQDIYYRWQLIHADPDDNKFVDCAIASGATYIVSDDNHFKVLKQIDFPKVEVLTSDDFLREISK